MIKVYQTIKSNVVSLEEPALDTWIDIISPTEEDIKSLERMVEIDEDIIRSIRDYDEVPKMEKYDGYDFILLQTPKVTIDQEDDEEDNDDEIYYKYSISPLGIIFRPDLIITLSEGRNDIIQYLRIKLKNFQKNKIINTFNVAQFVLKLLLFTSKIYLRYLKAINQKLRQVQRNLELAAKNEEIMHLMDLQKSIVYFNTSLQSNQIVIEKITKRKFFNSNEDNEELIEDILDENKQAISTVKIYGQIITSTSNTFTSVISNNLNVTLRFLTTLTIILMIPTLVASIYGMNVELPFMRSQHAFSIVITISIVLSLFGAFWFYRKKLFE